MNGYPSIDCCFAASQRLLLSASLHASRAPPTDKDADRSLMDANSLPERASERAWSDSLPCTKRRKKAGIEELFFFFSLSELSQRVLEWSFEAKLSLFLSFSRSSLSTRATHSHNSPLKLAAMASALAFSSCTSAVLSQQQQRRGNSSTVVVAASKARCASIASAVVASSTKPRRCVVAFILDLTRISIAANRAHRKLSLATKKGVSKSSR